MKNKYTGFLYDIYHWIAMLPGKISWSKKRSISESDKAQLAATLASGYYVILTYNKSYLSDVVISLLTFLKTGKWAKYCHALMNCDNITDATDTKSFKFLEATSVGVHYSDFDTVFDCDRVCLLTPKNVANEEWTKIIDALLSQKGLPYDDLFSLADSTHVSCVELVLDALKAADYKDEFANLDAMIKKEKNLVPQMFRDCPDFAVKIELE
jgi:hypothetical protein